MIRLGYPTQNLMIPSSTNRTCRLASLHDAEKVRGLIRENFAGLETILRWIVEAKGKEHALVPIGVEI